MVIIIKVIIILNDFNHEWRRITVVNWHIEPAMTMFPNMSIGLYNLHSTRTHTRAALTTRLWSHYYSRSLSAGQEPEGHKDMCTVTQLMKG